MLAQQLAELQVDEGLRLTVYDDGTGGAIGPGHTLKGHPTIGYGRALDVHGITNAEAHYLLSNDIAQIETTLAAKYAWFSKLDAVRQGAVTNVCFGVGFAGLAKFVDMLADIAAGAHDLSAVMMQASAQEFDAAANELQDSLWARQVQPSRSAQVIYELRTGKLATSAALAAPVHPTFSLGALALNVSGAVDVRIDRASLSAIRDLFAGLTTTITDIVTQGVQAMSGSTDTLATELANLQTAVQQETTVNQSAIALLNGIPALIQAAVQQAVAAGADPASLSALNNLASTIAGNATGLAAAVTANTPATPPTPAPTPTP